MNSGRDFWSRRKAGVEAEQKLAEEDLRKTEYAEHTDISDEDLLANLELPEPETLQTPEDLRAFLQDAVPQRLKTRALRHMWRLNPVLANLDGLVDYGEDFTDAATVVENMQTAYQVGKGMLTAFANDDDEETDTDEHREIETEEPEEEPALAYADPVPLPEPEQEPTAEPRRRMRFAFSDA